MTDTPSNGSAANTPGVSTPISAASLTPPDHFAPVTTGSTLATTVLQMTPVADNDDDASDVSMTEDSDDDSEDGSRVASIIITQQTPIYSSLMHDPSDVSKKRKFPSDDEDLPTTQYRDVEELDDHKRIKTGQNRLPSDRSQLPAEIWHHIFIFSLPRVLGRLLQVNKTFRGYLDPSYSTPSSVLTPLPRSVVRIQSPEAIWQSSRRLFRSGMPSPLHDHSELEMWKLACTRRCQFCDRKGQVITKSTDKWHPGPNENGVIPVWPFGIRSCGVCLQTNSIKVGCISIKASWNRKLIFQQEIDLLLSSSIPSPLIAALPFIFLTGDLNVLSAISLQNEQPPSTIQLAKCFFKPHVEAIKAEFFKVKSMGAGTAEEWLKGLDDTGKDRRNDSARWERWEASGGVQQMRINEPAEVQDLFQIFQTATSSTVLAQTATKRQSIAIPQKLQALPNAYNASTPTPAPAPGTFSHMTMQAISAPFCKLGFIMCVAPTFVLTTPVLANVTPPHRFDSPVQNGFQSYPQRPLMHNRQDRTKEEVADLKAARRSEIERRCMLLQPPVTPAVLSHMASFQAAIQIIKPMDDNQWEVLKPRLLAQRDDAEQRENDRITQARLVQEKYDERHQLDIPLKEAKEFVDKDWEDIQTPVRTRIGGYADEIIRDGWEDGVKVTKENCPSFAADVLMYVRKRFYAEIAKDEAAARAAGQEPKVDPPSGPFTQKLILENMKWVFDIKIKPHTEQYRKELFLCNGCDGMNSKFYGFEGVIQHYAAKHTSALSLGSIVVHWRAEWPELPPFNPDPTAEKSSFYPPATSTVTYSSGAATLPQAFGYGGYPSTSGQIPSAIPAQQHPSGYQQSPGPYYGHPQFGDQYQRPQSGPFAPPPTFPGQPQHFPGHSYQNSQGNGFQQYQGQGYASQAFDGSYSNVTQLTYESPHPSQVYPVSMVENSGQSYTPAPIQAAGQFIPGSYNAGPIAAGIHRTEEYTAQLQDVAKNARELWNHTSGVKSMPGSVRVYVILYHVLQRSRARFPEDPPLTMLIDGLSNNKDMRPVRNVNGLACRACILGKAHDISQSSSRPQGTMEKKFFSLPQLLNHFQATHIGDMHPPPLDWTQDMVELPDNAKIAALAFAQGMDEHKISLVTEALPGAFKVPAPRDEPSYADLAPSRDDHLKYYAQPSQPRPSDPVRVEYGDYPPIERIPQGTPVLVTSAGRRPYEDTRSDYSGQAPMTYIGRRAVSPMGQVRVVDDHTWRPIRDDDHVYLEPVRHYRDSDVHSYGPRDSGMAIYDEVPRNERGYRADVPLARLLEERAGMATASSGSRDQEMVVVQASGDHRHRGNSPSRPVSVLGPPLGLQPPSRGEPLEGGSEDGELLPQSTKSIGTRNLPASLEAENAAERFLNEFQPGENAEDYAKKAEEAERREEEALRSIWETERIESMRRMHEAEPEQQRIVRDNSRHGDARDVLIGRPRATEERASSSANPRVQYERLQPQQRQPAIYDYEDRYAKSERPGGRVRSPELVDHRYLVNDPADRDDRKLAYSSHSTASRYAPYDNIKIDHERVGRSRSPVYVKLGALPGQYREQSPGPRYVPQDSTYRTRSPHQQLEGVRYERVPRPEFYRVYADEPRRAPPRYEGQVEYVQVADPQGDYVIRRPVQRDHEPMYATYDDGGYTREPVYESRAPVSRSDPAYYEEYDPRNPAPPPSATIRQQVRYQ